MLDQIIVIVMLDQIHFGTWKSKKRPGENTKQSTKENSMSCFWILKKLFLIVQ